MATNPTPPLPRRYTKQFQQAQKQKRVQQNILLEQQKKELEEKLAREKITNVQEPSEQEKVLRYYLQAGYSPRLAEAYKDLYVAEKKLEELKSSGANFQLVYEQEKTINGIKQDIGRIGSAGGRTKKTNEEKQKLKDYVKQLNEAGYKYDYTTGKVFGEGKKSPEYLFIDDKPVVGGYSSTSGETVFLTSGGASTQIPASFSQNYSSEGLPVSRDIPKGTLTTDYAVGVSESQRFTKYTPQKEEVVRAEFSGVEKFDKQKEEERLERFGAFRPIEEARVKITPQAERVGKNLLLGARDISEAPYKIGAESFRRVSDTGRDIGKFIGKKIYPNVYNPFISDEEYVAVRERFGIIGGTAVGILPYFAGGGITQAQRVADIGSAYLESPTKAFTLAGIGVASTVLFNQASGVYRLAKGQLGGTISGGAYAKSFWNFENLGGLALRGGLLIPYASQELPPLVSAYERADSETFRKGFASIQRTYAPLYYGGIVGQKISTGFTLFAKSPNAIVTGGLNAPTETLARKRLIANVFDAKPGSRAYETRQFYEQAGFTKQKFLESYNKIFSIKPSSVRATEFNPAKIEAISKNVKAQKALLKYFKEYSGEFRVYGSTVQAPQLRGVKSRLTQDVDILAVNPKKFILGAKQALIKAGVPKSELKAFVGVEKGYLSFSGKKFLSVYDISKDKTFFGQVESVAGVLPQRVFTRTPSGINISNIRFQGARKIVGGFVDFREKDISDVATINQGIVSKQKEFFKFSKALAKIEGLPEPVFNNQFGLSAQGQKLLEKDLPTVETNLRVKDILRINPNSQPIKDISTITGVPRKELVSKLRQLPVEGFTPIEKIRYGPSVGAVTGPTEKGNLGLKLRQLPKSFNNKTFEESVIVHELEHAGERIAGITSGRPTNRFNYFTSGSEQRAYAVQERFLEARGQTLPSDILFRTGVKGNTSLISRVTTQPVKVFTPEEIKKLYASAVRLNARSSRDYYYAPVKPPAYYYAPPPKREYVAPYNDRVYTPPTYAPPYTPLAYKAPPYTPPYSPPAYKAPPYTPAYTSAPYTPPYTPPNYTPPYTPPYNAPPSTPPYSPPYTPRPPSAPPKTPPVKNNFTEARKGTVLGKAFQVQTKKGGKIITLKQRLTYDDAVNYGANIADRTARASFRVVEAEGFVKPIGISPSRTKFRLSKQKNGFLVEPEKLRLNVRSERYEVAMGKLINRKGLFRL